MDAEPLGRVTQFLHLLRGALPSSGFRATACPLASRVHNSDANEAGRPTLSIGVRRRFPAGIPVAVQARSRSAAHSAVAVLQSLGVPIICHEIPAICDQ